MAASNKEINTALFMEECQKCVEKCSPEIVLSIGESEFSCKCVIPTELPSSLENFKYPKPMLSPDYLSLFPSATQNDKQK